MTPGTRVAIHPACDAWMQGDRYGDVATVGRKYITVRLDSGRKRRFMPADVREVA